MSFFAEDQLEVAIRVYNEKCRVKIMSLLGGDAPMLEERKDVPSQRNAHEIAMAEEKLAGMANSIRQLITPEIGKTYQTRFGRWKMVHKEKDQILAVRTELDGLNDQLASKWFNLGNFHDILHEVRQPREFWLCNGTLFDSEAEAVSHARRHFGKDHAPPLHVREVLP